MKLLWSSSCGSFHQVKCFSHSKLYKRLHFCGYSSSIFDALTIAETFNFPSFHLRNPTFSWYHGHVDYKCPTFVSSNFHTTRFSIRPLRRPIHVMTCVVTVLNRCSPDCHFSEYMRKENTLANWSYRLYKFQSYLFLIRALYSQKKKRKWQPPLVGWVAVWLQELHSQFTLKEKYVDITQLLNIMNGFKIIDKAT